MKQKQNIIGPEIKIDPKLKILVVDDSQETVDLIKFFLYKNGLENVVSCADAESGWILLNRSFSEGNTFELLLVDWNMPGITGVELLKRVRASEKYKDIIFSM